MNKNSLLLILVILLIFPIVKADGCGITCPSVDSKATFFSKLWCQFWTWAFCNVLAWIAFIIIVVIGVIFWVTRDNEQQKKIKLCFYGISVVLLLGMFYPSIKALLFTSPFIPPSVYCNDICDSLSLTTGYTIYSRCTTNGTHEVWEVNPHLNCTDDTFCYCYMRCTPYSFEGSWFECPFTSFFCMFNSEYPPYEPADRMGYIFPNRNPDNVEDFKLTAAGDLTNINITLTYNGTSDYDMFVLWNWIESEDINTCPNSTIMDCGLGNYNESSTGKKVCMYPSIITGTNVRVKVNRTSGSGYYTLEMNCSEC